MNYIPCGRLSPFLAVSMGLYTANDWVNAKMGGRKVLDEIMHWEM